MMLTMRVCGLSTIPSVAGHWCLFASFLDPGYPNLEVHDGITFDRRAIFRFHDVIDRVPGCIEPSRDDVHRWIALVAAMPIANQKSVLVNCHLGLSRSVAAAAIAYAVAKSEDLSALPNLLASLSPRPWPNRRMLAFADDILHLGGSLSEAGLATRLQTARLCPEWVEQLASTHRAPEVDEVRARL
jgi:predicted protein tyrosine phosphatase